ncbi:protein arginine N-methyltransferase [Aphelenchoides avenae]|nr:protein arginine N-methyltransferase [Aphelenchus avenae]
MVLYALPVRFEHLWKIAAPVGVVEGFDLSEFDAVCQKAHAIADKNVEPQPLWEYSSVATGEAVECARIELEGSIANWKQIEFSASLKPLRPGTDGVAMWVDWITTFSDGSVYRATTGLAKECSVGQEPMWHMGHRQGVHLIPQMDLPPDFTIDLKSSVDGDFSFKDFAFSYV